MKRGYKNYPLFLKILVKNVYYKVPRIEYLFYKKNSLQNIISAKSKIVDINKYLKSDMIILYE